VVIGISVVQYLYGLCEPKKGDFAMPSGKVKWFNESKGFGFIEQDSGEDIFVHYTSIQGDGFKTLMEGQRVEYEVTDGPKGLKAENVTASDAETV
jgi:CspA family cold shock protein